MWTHSCVWAHPCWHIRVCECTHVDTFMYVSTPMQECIWRTEVVVGCLPWLLLTSFSEAGSLSEPGACWFIFWLAVLLWGPYLCPLSTRYVTSTVFLCGVEYEPQSSGLYSKQFAHGSFAPEFTYSRNHIYKGKGKWHGWNSLQTFTKSSLNTFSPWFLTWN